MRLDPGTKLGPYEILAPLGAGGMGEVYKARDTRLGRDVAIKVLPERLAADPQALARFEREARAVAALSHPNLLSLFDIGAEQGISYAVTELLEGETLRARLRRGALDWRKAAEIGAALVEGLAAAYSKGIIHRDLKPENIFLTTDERIKILDFGLARWKAPVAAAGDSSAPTETQTGAIVGTFGYMSPEQVRGENVDAAGDIFSLGCVLYEMIAGRRAFSGASTADTISAVLHQEPSPIPGCPAELRRLIGRCLRKNAAERVQSAREVAAELNDLRSRPPRRVRPAWWIPAAMVVLVAAISFYWFGHRARKAIDSLAVLPFVNAGTDADAEYLSDGISETLMTQLSRVPGLKVKSRDSVFRYKGKEAEAAGKELGVRAVLKGRIVERGGNLSIAVELVDTSDNNLIWREQYSRKMGDILSMEEEISREVYAQLRVKLTGEERKQVARRSTENVEAYQLYLRCRYGWDRRTEEIIANSLEYCREAVEKDPRFALAWAELAGTYSALGLYAMRPRQETYERAKAAAERALALDDTIATAHIALARVKTEYEWDWAGAEREYQRAIALDPDSGRPHQNYGVHLAAVGRTKEAVAEMRRAVELEPMAPIFGANVGWYLYVDHRYGEAEPACRKAIEMDPNYPWGHNCLAAVYLATGRYREAVAEQQQAIVLSKRGNLELTYLGYALAVSGDRAGALKVLDEIQEIRRKRFFPLENIAVVYAGLGDKDRAFEWFEKAFAERSMHSWIYPDPRLDAIRSDPRFKDLMRRMGLPPN